MKRFISLIAVSLSLLLTACGGGGGSAGASGVTPSTPVAGSDSNAATVTAAITATDLVVSLDKVTLKNTGSDRVALTAIAVNAAGNAVPGTTITVAVDNGGVFQTSSALEDGVYKTGDNGSFVGIISSPGSKENRSINVTVSSGTAKKTTTIVVTGTDIKMTAVPGAPTIGQAMTLNLNVVDANGTGIPNAPLTITGLSAFPSSGSTDFNGSAVIAGNAPSTPGLFSIDIASNGVRKSFPLTVVGSASAIPNAVGVLGPGALDASPTAINFNAGSNSNNRSVLTFKMIDANNQPVKNVRVKFIIDGEGLKAGEKMSTGDSVVYTDESGLVSSDYIPGTRSSPNDGVTVRACFGATDAEVATCTNSRIATLTVTGLPLNISIFDNNTLLGRFNNTAYVQTLLIQVVNSAGQPVPDVVVSTSVDVTHYGKGPSWGADYAAPALAPSIRDTYSDTLSRALNPTLTVVTNADGTTRTFAFNVWCMNEDLNRNGTLDAGEDLDGDGVLEPRSSDVAIQAPNGNKTDQNGNMLIDLSWGQNVGRWIAFTVKAAIGAQGSEGTNSRSFITNVLEGDVRNGAFLTPPYGVKNCGTNG